MDEGRVLLTGATGFLGGELLQRLLGREARRIVCLVRADDDAAAARRGEQTLRWLLDRAPTEAERSRVEWLRGDVEHPRFGLPPDRYRELAARTEEIFHCAATTRFDLSLADAQRINVHGAQRVLRFAEAAVARGGLRRLHHVSTAFASGLRRDEVLAGELPDDEPRHFRNSYERTKARAERLLRAQRRVPCTIYRPSIILGDSRSGRATGWTTVYFPMRLVADGHLPFLPCGGRQLLDCVPVDFVADAVVALGQREETADGVYHLTAGADAVTVEEVLRDTEAGLLRQRGGLPRKTRPVGPVGWWWLDRFYGLLARGRARRGLAQLRLYVPYTRIDAVYDNRRETELLAKDGVELPPPREFFPRIVDYALRADFGRAQRGAAERSETGQATEGSAQRGAAERSETG